jgi:hypothetical protein
MAHAPIATTEASMSDLPSVLNFICYLRGAMDL